jgi:hypothetical protein
MAVFSNRSSTVTYGDLFRSLENATPWKTKTGGTPKRTARCEFL